MANSKLTMELSGVASAGGTCTGQFACPLPKVTKNSVQEGGADGEQNSVFEGSPSIAASGSLTIDFQSINNIVNEQFIVGAGDVAALLIKNLSVAEGGGGGDVTLAPGAVNGWNTWLQTGSVMNLPAGCSIMLDGLPAGAYPVTAGTSQLDIAEVGGVNQADLQLQIWARK